MTYNYLPFNYDVAKAWPVGSSRIHGIELSPKATEAIEAQIGGYVIDNPVTPNDLSAILVRADHGDFDFSQDDVAAIVKVLGALIADEEAAGSGVLRINDAVIDATEFAYDGCHKIFLISSAADREKMIVQGGYTDSDILPVSRLLEVWESTCPLRFISRADLTEVLVQQADPEPTITYTRHLTAVPELDQAEGTHRLAAIELIRAAEKTLEDAERQIFCLLDIPDGDDDLDFLDTSDDPEAKAHNLVQDAWSKCALAVAFLRSLAPRDAPGPASTNT
jgi:hypothetical protein